MKKIILTITFLFFTTKVDAQVVNENRLRAHLKFLASDELEGRETSFRGQKIAAKYISSHFLKLGLESFDKENTYLQKFPLIHTTISESSKIIILRNNQGSENILFGKDFIPTYAVNDTNIISEVVFAGYGIHSKKGYSDYDTNYNYKGKIILVLRGASNDSSSKLRSSSNFFKKLYASQNGATALIIIDEDDEHSFEKSYKENLNNLTKGNIYPPQNERKDIPIILISKAKANKLLFNSNTDVEKLIEEIKNNQSYKLRELKNLKLNLDIKRNVKNVSGENVLGLLPGADSVLKNEYVIVTAHYDHIGQNLITNDVFNGADDDASGTSSVLELAEIFSKQKPKRSILFMPVSGEEKGLLGSNFYTENPLIPLEKSISNINIDMIGRNDERYDSIKSNNYVYVIGSDKLSLELDSILVAANKKSAKIFLDYKYNDDNDPNQFYRRSDHFNFAKNNIPVIFFFNGTHADYHKETDEFEKIDFDALKKRTELIYQTIFDLANAPKKPKLK